MKLCIIQAAVTAIIYSSCFSGSSDLFAQNPLVTVRFANPNMNCSTNQYCVDVEFKSNTLGIELFGMNVRLFYDESVLELINFTDFQGGYSAVAPNPPIIQTGSLASGPALFNFVGAAEFVNGAIQLTSTSAPDIILDDWSKIFKICFNVDNAGSDPENFCASIVWDLEQDPANGGFLAGDDGVVMTVVDPDPFIESAPADEAVVQFNWHYIGSGSPPYGAPDQTYCISVNCYPLLVTNMEDSGVGSLRNAISSAINGDTIKFHPNLAGGTILINSNRLVINYNIVIWSNLVPTVKIASNIQGLFDIGTLVTPEIRNVNIESGINGYPGAAFYNFGHLILHDTKVNRNPSLSIGQYLINNMPGSQLELRGSCSLEW